MSDRRVRESERKRIRVSLCCVVQNGCDADTVEERSAAASSEWDGLKRQKTRHEVNKTCKEKDESRD